MSKKSQFISKILSALSVHKKTTGAELARELGISRTAVWKIIHQLKDKGVPIQSHQSLGYSLAEPNILLSKERISAGLALLPCRYTLSLFNEIDSTNRYLKLQPSLSCGINICLAEMQTAGRGRFKREWLSPYAQNIYCSIRYRLEKDISELSGLSTVVSLAIIALLQASFPALDVGLKWPNDIFINGNKISGTLIEILAEPNSHAEIIIGIGINVNMIDADIQTAWTSLRKLTGRSLDRNDLVINLVKRVVNYLMRFEESGVDEFVAMWRQVDLLYNKHLLVEHHQTIIQGIGQGIDKKGHLLVEDHAGTQHVFSSGDASLHKGYFINEKNTPTC